MTTYAQFNPTSLVAGAKRPVHRPVTLHNSTALSRGTLLGHQTIGAASSAAHAGNTGNGTLTLDATTPVLAKAQPGIYNVSFTSATAYSVFDPNGNELGQGVNGSAFANQIKFVTAAGGAAFVAGDSFQVPIAALDKYVPCVKTAIDGSQVPVAILCDDADPSGGDITAPAYFEGEFAGEMMVIDPSWTIATVQAELRAIDSPLYVRSIGQLG